MRGPGSVSTQIRVDAYAERARARRLAEADVRGRVGPRGDALTSARGWLPHMH